MYDEIDPHTASVLLAEGWVYVDVRTPQEFGQGHPTGAINVPVMIMGPMGIEPNPNFVSVVADQLGPETKLVLGCKSGGRSARACQLLGAAGYGQLANMLGGFSGGKGPDGQPIDGWRAAGLPVSS